MVLLVMKLLLHMAKKISYKSSFKNKISIACTGFASKPSISKENQQGVVFVAANYGKKINVVKKIFLKKKRIEVINLNCRGNVQTRKFNHLNHKK